MTQASLAGSWMLHDAKGVEVGACNIPGDIHSALLALGKIPDPLIGTNELDVRWVAETEWEIRRNFDVNAADLAGKWPVLDLEFVDTIADVTVNGTLVAKLESSFVRHRLDLGKVLKAGKNDIAIRFHSSVLEAKARAAKQPFPIPYSVSNNIATDLNMLRKAQCHGGWDWGPCVMVLGVYAEPVLRFFDDARIEHVIVRQKHHDGGKVTLTADVELLARRDATIPVTFTVAGRTAKIDVKTTVEHGGKTSLSIDIENPDLWWPAGCGAQPLYDAVVTVPGDSVKRRVGIRKLELINVPDEIGMSMTFRVNGIDIFCKGANWIPADALPSRITRERIELLLREAAIANMNMIRVWGGGFYEFDAFYDICDELGLLVWQDMMFACSQYPSTPEFCAVVDAEVRYQVKRLGSHPSIALWCGDNEVVGSLTWYELSKKNRDRYLVNYDRLNRVIEMAILESDPDRAFWPSSPCSGKLDFGDAWHKDNAGDMHFWSVWHENRDFEHYYDVKPRFCSEFGFQSFPTMHVIRRFAEPKDWNATSPVMEFHQRSGAGNGKIVETMTRYFRIPTSFERFLFLSQLQQALAIETAVRYWRSLKPNTMGTIYWQLNDVWPSVSWSSLDHAMGWKTLHYHARRFFAPVALAARIDNGALILSGLNDGLTAAEVDARVRRIDLDGKVLDETPVNTAIPPDRAIEVARVGIPAGRDFFYLVEGKTKGAADFDPAMRFVTFPDKYKRYDLPDAKITLAAAGKPGTFTVSADKPAFFVKPEASEFGGAFDDASFALLPGEKRTLTFRSFDGRMPAATDVAVNHIGETYR
ncbi:MAG TPA: glycoside hydrolase family 2 protein [Bauldia sp.]|nr:glycoside hydrolase family 2 protein [Bauldia sp.]